MGWFKKVFKKIVDPAGIVIKDKPKAAPKVEAPKPPAPPAAEVQLAKADEKDKETEQDTASKKKKEKRRGKKGLVVEREKGTGLSV